MSSEQLAESFLDTAPIDSKSFLKDIKQEFTGLNRKQLRFLVAYCACGGVRAAGDKSKVLWVNHYRWLREHEDYREAFNKAREWFADYAEQDVFDRAFLGADREVLFRDGTIRRVRNKSDILAMFALKGLRPSYRDNAQVNINTSGPTQINFITQVRPTMPDNLKPAPASEPTAAPLIPYIDNEPANGD